MSIESTYIHRRLGVLSMRRRRKRETMILRVSDYIADSKRMRRDIYFF